MEAKYWQFSLETIGKSLSKSDSIFIDQRGQMRITFLLVSNWLIYREIIDYLEKYHKLHP